MYINYMIVIYCTHQKGEFGHNIFVTGVYLALISLGTITPDKLHYHATNETQQYRIAASAKQRTLLGQKGIYAVVPVH